MYPAYIFPPRISVNCFAIARPRPVLPLVLELSVDSSRIAIRLSFFYIMYCTHSAGICTCRCIAAAFKKNFQHTVYFVVVFNNQNFFTHNSTPLFVFIIHSSIQYKKSTIIKRKFPKDTAEISSFYFFLPLFLSFLKTNFLTSSEIFLYFMDLR